MLCVVHFYFKLRRAAIARILGGPDVAELTITLNDSSTSCKLAYRSVVASSLLAALRLSPLAAGRFPAQLR